MQTVKDTGQVVILNCQFYDSDQTRMTWQPGFLCLLAQESASFHLVFS